MSGRQYGLTQHGSMLRGVLPNFRMFNKLQHIELIDLKGQLLPVKEPHPWSQRPRDQYHLLTTLCGYFWSYYFIDSSFAKQSSSVNVVL